MPWPSPTSTPAHSGTPIPIPGEYSSPHAVLHTHYLSRSLIVTALKTRCFERKIPPPPLGTHCKACSCFGGPLVRFTGDGIVQGQRHSLLSTRYGTVAFIPIALYIHLVAYSTAKYTFCNKALFPPHRCIAVLTADSLARNCAKDVHVEMHASPSNLLTPA